MPSLNTRELAPGQKVRVLVVDDSVVIRQLVSHALEQEPQVEVVGTAANGAIALQRIVQLKPDVLTLDIEMPEMDGLETLRHLRRDHAGIRTIMFSTLTERGAAATLEALSLGADDYVTKASNAGSLDTSMERLRGELVPKILQFFRLAGSAPAVNRRLAPVATAAGARVRRLRSIAIGVSTGGPTALGAVLPALPESFPLPVFVVQHMPALFTRLLAERLNATCRLPVAEARHGDRVTPGKVFIAPGDFHMRLVTYGGEVRIELDQAPPVNSCRPSVDTLFASVHAVYGGAVAGVVLTGMGQDGLQGVRMLKQDGATIIAQDEPSSVVWGMPGAVVRAGLADHVMPLDEVAREILRAADGSRTTI